MRPDSGEAFRAVPRDNAVAGGVKKKGSVDARAVNAKIIGLGT